MLRSASLLVLFPLSVAAYAQAGTMTVGGLERTYTLRLPSGYDGTTALPLLICMHGGSDSVTQVESRSQLTVKAEQVRLHLGIPRWYGRYPHLERGWLLRQCGEQQHR